MKMYDANDFAAVLSAMPNNPGNVPAANILRQMMEEQKIIKNPYTFEVDFSTGAGALTGQFAAPVIGGAAVQGNFNVDSSSPFLLVSSVFKSDIAGAAQLSGTKVIPNATVFITDQSGNRNWMNVAVPVPSLFGDTAGLPYFWPIQRLIPASTVVTVTLLNFDPAVTPNTRLSFHGYRYYAAGT